MTDPILNPPGVIQEAESLDTIARLCNAEHIADENSARAAAVRAKKIGDLLLSAKERCPHGTWLDWLKKHIRFNHQQASKYMRVASNWGKLLPSSNLSDIYRFLAEEAKADDPPPPLTLTEQPRINPPLCFVCARAVRTGQAPKKGCKDCFAMRVLAEKPEAPEEEREPGIDEEEQPPLPKPPSGNKGGRPKSGSEMVTLDSFRTILGKLGAEVDKAAHQFGLERNGRSGQAPSVIETPEILGINRLMKEMEKAVELFLKAAKKAAKDQTSTQGE